MKDVVLDIIAAIFKIDKNNLPENPSSNSLENWDSLKHLQLIETLEKEFNIQFEILEYGKLTDLNAIVQIISKKPKLS